MVVSSTIPLPKTLKDYTTEELLAEIHRRVTYMKVKIAKITGDKRT